jgi:regulator of sigma E protease
VNFLQTLLAFLVALTLLVFVHELGHYLVARWCNVKVLRFSIGFGPALFTRRVGPDQTEWVLASIPLGGYVKMLNEEGSDAEPVAAADLPRSFSRQPLSKRAAIVAAGPIANFLLAIVLYVILNAVGALEPAARIASPAKHSPAAIAGLEQGDRIVSIDGRQMQAWNDLRLGLIDAIIERRSAELLIERDSVSLTASLQTDALPAGELERDFLKDLGLRLAHGPVSIVSVLSQSAAERAGLQAGDQIIAVNGKRVLGARAFIETIRANVNKPLSFEIVRADQGLNLKVVPESYLDEADKNGPVRVGRIGARVNEKLEMVQVRHLGLDGAVRAVVKTWDMSLFSLRMMGKMLIGEVSWRNLSGPVSIADYAGQSARIGWQSYLSFLALISISLGVLNLLPIPILDGGHLVYYGLEAVRGRALSERSMELTQKAGLALIASMMVVALFNDLTRLIGS